MKLINSSFEILEQGWTLDDIYKQIEIGGRTAYKSEDKITENSAKEFVDRMIKSNHGSTLEHGTVYLTIPITSPLHDIGYLRKMDAVNRYKRNPYSKVVDHTKDHYGFEYHVTTNMRVIKENQWDFDLQYLCEPTEYHEKRVSVRMKIPISISREFNRHRTFSITESSTRYCNYSTNKFNNEITFIKPYWYDKFNKECINGYREDGTSDMFISADFEQFLMNCENQYLAAVIAGCKPQEAREMLPLCTATDVVYTAFISDWNHFFSLRTPESAHPQAREIAIPLKEEFINRNYI